MPTPRAVYRTLSTSMTVLLLAALLLVLSFSYEGQWNDNAWRIDLLPDWPGRALAAAGYGLAARAASGGTRRGLTAIAVVAALGALLSEARRVSDRPAFLWWSDATTWGLLAAHLVAPWFLAALCRTLRLEVGAFRWRVVAIALPGLIGATSLALFLGFAVVVHQYHAGGVEGFPWLLVAGLVGLGLAAVASLALTVWACVGTRCESLLRAQHVPERALVSPLRQA